MKIYFVQIREAFENTCESRDVYYYFNSEEAMNNWLKWFREQYYSLQEYVTSGEAYFNKSGILNP